LRSFVINRQCIDFRSFATAPFGRQRAISSVIRCFKEVCVTNSPLTRLRRYAHGAAYSDTVRKKDNQSFHGTGSDMHAIETKWVSGLFWFHFGSRSASLLGACVDSLQLPRPLTGTRRRPLARGNSNTWEPRTCHEGSQARRLVCCGCVGRRCLELLRQGTWPPMLNPAFWSGVLL